MTGIQLIRHQCQIECKDCHQMVDSLIDHQCDKLIKCVNCQEMIKESIFMEHGCQVVTKCRYCCKEIKYQDFSNHREVCKRKNMIKSDQWYKILNKKVRLEY